MAGYKDPRDTSLGEPMSPQVHRLPTNIEVVGDGLARETLCSAKGNLRAENETCGCGSAPTVALELHALIVGQA
ncbi:MAG: hypothetical protein AAFU79_32600 [Myxococcota bacterium]